MNGYQEKMRGSRRPLALFGAAAAFGLAFGGISFVASGALADGDGADAQASASASTVYPVVKNASPVAGAASETAAAPAEADSVPVQAAVPETGASPAEAAAEPVAVETAVPAEAVEPVAEQPAPSVAPAPAEPAAEAASSASNGDGNWYVSVNCSGGQAEIDGCVGATNFLPATEVLGVPYYAQHDYLGGAAWLDIQIGETVVAEGVSYRVSDMRTIVSGGSSDQVVDMPADAFLQTCLDDGVHSRVLALARIA